MKLIEWKSEYNIGHDIIDGQHRRIVRIINELIKNQDAAVHSEFISSLLNDIVKYGIEHFKQEEMVMQEYNYPSTEEHHKQHLQFKLKGAIMCQEVMNNKKELPQELLEYLKKWWMNHILVEDHKMKYLF